MQLPIHSLNEADASAGIKFFVDLGKEHAKNKLEKTELEHRKEDFLRTGLTTSTSDISGGAKSKSKPSCKRPAALKPAASAPAEVRKLARPSAVVCKAGHEEGEEEETLQDDEPMFVEEAITVKSGDDIPGPDTVMPPESLFD